MKKYFYSLVTDQKNDFIAKIIKVFLCILSLIYGFCVGITLFFYKINIFKKHKLPCKVISVGNLTWGGTGKTPFLIELANYLRNQGHNLAILTRGYKNYKNTGDEACFLKDNLINIPIISGKNRLKNAKIALENYNVDTIILDDGFQHWKIVRDLDIVLLDSINPFGNRKLIPRGILREPISSLKRANIFILTKIDLANDIRGLKENLITINPKALILESRHWAVGLYDLKDANKILDLNILKNKNVCNLCAIADPISFIKTLKNLGANIVLSFSFLDHHDYNEGDLKKIINKCKENNINTIITTQKDAIKLKDLDLTSITLEIFVLKIKWEILKDKEKLYDQLLGLYTH